MLFYYPMLVHEEEGYWAEFPDLPGCNAWGDTFEELFTDAQGALNAHIYGILSDGEKLSQPSKPNEIETDDRSYVVLISVDVDINKKNKSVKKTLTIPYWLNERAEKEGLNFSKTLQEALIDKIATV